MRLVPYNNRWNGYRDLDNFFDGFMKSALNSRMADRTFPLDIEEKEDSYVIEADMPGVDKNNVSIDIEDGRLTIAVNVEESEEKKDEEKNYLHRERRVMSSSRSVELGDIDAEKVEAEMENGVLRITVPKVQEVSNRRSVNIK